jgi:hypothetical protein
MAARIGQRSGSKAMEPRIACGARLVPTLWAVAIFVLAPFGFAQTDPLGPHNMNGQGCFTCHTPQGGTEIAGQNDLWGLQLVLTSYPGYNGAIVNFDTEPQSQDDPKFHSMICLSCHDGSMARQGMRGRTVEPTQEGAHPGTLLATDNAALANDHPIDVPYVPGGELHWPGRVDASGTLTFGATSPSFDYGHPARLYGTSANGGQSMVECSTCHNPHSMRMALVKVNGIAVNKPTAFYVRGWYDVRPDSNSTSQFCRSCHYNWSNESHGLAVPTN